MAALRHQLLRKVAPLIASTMLVANSALAAGSYSNQKTPKKTPHIQKISNFELINVSDFRGKTFDERMTKAEEIVQRYNIENKTQFSDIFSVLLKKMCDHGIINDMPQYVGPNLFCEFVGPGEYKKIMPQVLNDAFSLICLGHTQAEIDPTLSYSEQLRFCGLDSLADVLDDKLRMTNLSDKERSRLFEQLGIAVLLGESPEYARLASKVVEQDETNGAYPLCSLTSKINGHNMNGESVYMAEIAKKVQRKITGEKPLNLASPNRPTLR